MSGTTEEDDLACKNKLKVQYRMLTYKFSSLKNIYVHAELYFELLASHSHSLSFQLYYCCKTPCIYLHHNSQLTPSIVLYELFE